LDGVSYLFVNRRNKKNILFVDDQVLKPDSEKSFYNAKHSKNFGVEISPEKSEKMTFSG
jgi:hypothetical protein